MAKTISSQSFQQDLGSWYQQHQRILPWRQNPSLYKTVVSEIMCQQTRIDTVLPYFHRWLERFPDFATLAQAPADDVLKHWEGLGYYSRARNLQKLAQTLHKLDTLPTDTAAWKKFPGIGPYTAATVTSIAFGTPAACVDGNVVRILTRLHALTTTFKDSATASKALQSYADPLLNHQNPGDHNQAMMELGATICHKSQPLCTICPVVQHCQAAAQGIAEQLPRLAPRKIVEVKIDRICIQQNQKILLQKGSAQARRLAHIYEFPDRQYLKFAKTPETLLFTGKRGISNQRLQESFYHCQPKKIIFQTPTDQELLWVPLDQLPTISLTGPHRKWLPKILPHLASSE